MIPSNLLPILIELNSFVFSAIGNSICDIVADRKLHKIISLNQKWNKNYNPIRLSRVVVVRSSNKRDQIGQQSFFSYWRSM